MRYIVIGAVAGGMTAAMKIRRNDDKAQIVVYDKDTDISYSGCSLAYYISGVIKDRKSIVPRDVEYFKKFNVEVKTSHEVLKVDTKTKSVLVKDLSTGNMFEDRFDKLIIATGAQAFIPKIEGINLDGIFTLRNVKDADRIKGYIEKTSPKKTLIIGGGYIGLEMAEALSLLGMEVLIVEKQKNILPNLDDDMARLVENYLLQKGIQIRNDSSVLRFEGEGKVKEAVLSDKSKIPADFVLISVGVRPNTEFLKDSGIELLENGAIKVDEYMRTNIEDIFAAGDCAAVYFKLNGKTMYVPLGSTANKMGRIAGENATGGNLRFNGILATSIFKVFDLTIAQTGYTEKMARQDEIEYEIGHVTKPHISTAYPGAEKMTIKALAELSSRKIIGAQIVGTKGVDKRIDVLATAIYSGLTVDDLFQLDLAYAPPFSSAKDPIHYVGMVMSNLLDEKKFNCTQEKLLQKIKNGEDFVVLDVRTPEQYQKKHIKGAINIPLEMIYQKINQLPKDKPIIVYCNSGVSSNIAQNILQQNGFRKVCNLSGGILNVTLPELLEGE
ncbi:FAD-dependent pyridine nucleotide-disulfide oxidoreductase [Caldicellulosiruptor saccharolyticus DSM 8903]|uniref:FAD-dependent pyridine nucleotide-disulfide oxidoreductase n=1 Tax=Caldicellulosiruptor saccharolyticus (strain ATCC 43494 / DSM 8903 / Tp8T 6331) TaxID=351627 RepID=A4XHJ3_CALS8|nr:MULTISPECIES: FAD-dependent oxidoreductase [Caldicellulosiruptor]ABP66378.1 FAD-dependent pyridine nucleotide-disulfide oxidoreductase [Caldicellulosiruptor saccharolyticus DSM 8903]